MRTVADIDLGLESAPDATTILKFRHPLEANEFTRRSFEEAGSPLTVRKLLMLEGTLMDATIRRVEFDEEPRAQTRPRCVSDQEGRPADLLHEGAHMS